MLWTNKQTDKQTDSNVLLTPTNIGNKITLIVRYLIAKYPIESMISNCKIIDIYPSLLHCAAESVALNHPAASAANGDAAERQFTKRLT